MRRPSRRRPAPGPAAVLLAVALVAAAAVPAAGLPVPAAPAGDPVRLLVGWRAGTPAPDAAAVVSAAGGHRVDRLDRLRTDVVEVPAGTAPAALARLRSAPGVAYAETDQRVRAADVVPTDPLWPDQWGPVVTRTPRAWDTTTGDAGVVVAVLDSGVDAAHPDLAGALVPGTDLVNRDNDPDDDNGHGTSVAGIVGARSGNGVGVAGYCPRCSVMAVKVLDDGGSGSLANVAAGIVFAADRGARVVNLSITSVAPSTTLANAIGYARGRGVVVVAAAGNEGDTIPRYPAGSTGAIGVVATTITDGRYAFSNFGPWAELAAPGCHVTLLARSTYRTFCGTSSASPAVAGIVGLMMSARLGATAAEVERALLLGADPTVPGDTASFGRVDAAAAVDAIVPPAVAQPGSTAPDPPTSVTVVPGNGSVTVRWAPPAAGGGEPLRGYRVTASPGGRTAEVNPRAVTFTMGRLTNGAASTLTVEAFTVAGSSPAVTADPAPVRPALPAIGRVAGAGRVETAVALSRRAYGRAAQVLVARADDYADALAAAPVAGRLDAPLLLTPGDGVPPAVTAELRRLGTTSAILVGGTAALTAQVEADLRAVGVTGVSRVSGATRFETARRLAEVVGGRSVYVTEGSNPDPARGWPDAVAVSGLAAFQHRPILLATRDTLPAETRAALVALGTTSVTVVGGTAAVSDAVVSALADPDGDGVPQVSVTRLAGLDRWDTSRLVADRALSAGAGAHRLWVATGRDWPDALAAGPAAAALGAVLLLVDGGDLAASPAAGPWVRGQGGRFQEAVIVGGTVPVSAEVEAALLALLR